MSATDTWYLLIVLGGILLGTMAGYEIAQLRSRGVTLTNVVRNSRYRWHLIGWLAALLAFGIWAILHFAEVIP